MKLIIVLSVIACGYAAKLDRTYLPPSNAATAGGSPGALAAPDTGFGQGLPNLSAGPVGSRPSSFDQNGGISNIPSGTGNIQGSGIGQASGNFPGTNAPGFNPNIGAQKPSFGQGFNNLESSAQSSRTPFGQAPQSNGQDFAQAEFKPERAQAAADRSAEILKYINENNGDSYKYSYETSNGISAEESGVATNGVRAQGGYSYTGDDGKSYSITYTADENGYQPQGEHLPTPHPIPEEILKSIEENARAAASGTQEGAYRPEEYESDSSSQQYGTGATNYNQPQRPIMTQQGQSSSFNQDQSPQRLSAQGSFNANQFNQQKSDQAPNQFFGSRAQPQNQYSQGIGSTDTVSYPESSGQYKQPQQSSQGPNNVFGTQQGQSNQKSQDQNGQGVGGNGYNYNRPTQGASQSQQGQSQKLSQGLEGLSGQQASQPTTQFNQQQRPIQGSNIPFGNQMRPSNQYSQGQASQDQKASGYNYNRPQKPNQDFNQFSGQKNQPGQTQQFSPSFDSSSKRLSSQPTGQSANQLNQQQRPFQSSNTQFGSQQGPQQYSQEQIGQGQKENGYNYNQPQSSAQGSRFPGPQQSTNKGAFGQQGGQPTAELNQPQRPLQGSNNIFGKQQESPKQYSQGQRGQDQGGNGYNYNQPQKLSQGSNQLSGFGNQLGQPQKFSQAGQSNNQFGQPQRPLQGSQSAGLGSQQGQSNQYSLGPKGQDQDENGYYYNRPQSSGSAPTSQGPFGQNRSQSSAQDQPGFPSRPTSNYDSNTIDFKNQGLRPGQQAFSNINTQSGSPTQGTQYSPETNKPSFGSPSITTPSANYSPVSGGNVEGSRPNERYQPSLVAASKFQPQPSVSQNKPASSSFGSPSLSQNAPSQPLAQGYQYGPGQSSNQSQRPGFDSVNQGFNGAPGANKGTSTGSEFGGPRQPPSFSPEEGYRY